MLDVDGVLIRGRPSDGRTWSADMEADLGITAEVLGRHFFRPYWQDIVNGRAALVECLTHVLPAFAPAALTVEALIAYWFEQDSRLDQAVLDDMASLRAEGIAIHLVTNQEHMRARYIMDVLDLATRVDGMFYSAALGCSKPDAAFFAEVARRAGHPAGGLLLVDDTAKNVEGAIEAGWSAVHWTGSERLLEVCDRASRVADGSASHPA